VNVSADPVAGADKKSSKFWTEVTSKSEKVLVNDRGEAVVKELPKRKCRFCEESFYSTNSAHNQRLHEIPETNQGR
jgi:hypothetical protein